jgi:putative phage-type endonuclease
MSAVLIGSFEVGSPDWHAARAKGLGGSEVAPLLGLSPYESRFSLWHRKAGQIGPVEVTEIMDAGTRLEDAICQKFADNHPEFLVRRAGTYRHAERPWQIANPDRMVYPASSSVTDAFLLEAKYALYDDGWGALGTDAIPLHYKCQVQWYLDVFGLDTCYVMVFIGSQGVFREYVVTADPTDQTVLRVAAKDFLASLETNERPDIDAHGATYSAIKEMHPDITPDKIELPTEIAHQYCNAKAAAKASEEAAQLATSLVADAMGNAQRATYVGQTIANRQARGNGTPYVVAARNLPTFDIEEAS